MFHVVLGQGGDDYVGGSAKDLVKALEVADRYARQVNERPVDKRTTYIYVLTPSGEHINVPYQTLSN